MADLTEKEKDLAAREQALADRKKALADLEAPVTRGEVESSLAKMTLNMETMASTLAILATKMGIEPKKKLSMLILVLLLMPLWHRILCRTLLPKEVRPARVLAPKFPKMAYPGEMDEGLSFPLHHHMVLLPLCLILTPLVLLPCLNRIIFLVGNILWNLISNMLLLNCGVLL